MPQKEQASQAVEKTLKSNLTGAHLQIESLQRELHEKEAQVRELIRDTLDAQEAERERICLEVHDGVTQTLASVFQYLQTLETSSLESTHARQLLLRASALVKQAIQESREVINSLQPATLRDLGLVATLRQEIRRMQQESRWKIEFKADAIRLPQDVETGLYRIIREAITNARKHADTKRIRISITSEDAQLKVEVRDWGVGFNHKPSDISSRRGTGLLSMRKRAEILQGTCHIQSVLGQGTVVSVEIPLSRYEGQHE
jgi:signal transduction histidine kinase